MVKSGESEREAAARSDELFEDGDIVAAGGKNHSEIRIKQKKSWVPVVFILPALAFLILFNYVPMYGILIAFQDYVPGDDFLSANTIWIGWQNFSMFFGATNFWQLIANTFILNILGFIIGFPLPIIVALLLNSSINKSMSKVMQTIFIAPNFISLVVMVGILYLFFGTTGFVNNVLESLGLERYSFFLEAGAFRPLYTLSGVWQGFGWSAIIYIAALSGVDPTLHEAAQIDGAGTFRCFIHVVLPVCQPILGAAVALSFADCWNLVEQPLTYLTTHTELYPLSVVFNQLTQQSTGVEFAGAALYTLPALLIYLYFQNDILEGVQLTELK